MKKLELININKTYELNTQNETDNTITIWAYDAYAEAATKAVEIYEREHPDCEYNFEVVALGQDDMVEKIKIGLATNSRDTLPDIFYDEDYNFAEYLTYYEELFYDLSAKVQINDYYSYKTVNVTSNNKVYALPYESGTGVLFYRSDIIHQAGYSDSDMQNLTWSEFISIGQKVKNVTGIDMITMCPEGDMEGRLWKTGSFCRCSITKKKKSQISKLRDQALLFFLCCLLGS